MTFSFKALASTTIADKASDLLWARKYHVGAVSYHSGSHDRGCTALRPITARAGDGRIGDPRERNWLEINRNVQLEGPGFRYTPNAGFHGDDSFTVEVLGSADRMRGSSTIRVAVSVKE
jgi:hypothetical protein